MHFYRAKSADKMEHTEDSVVVRDMSVRATLKITPAGTGHRHGRCAFVAPPLFVLFATYRRLRNLS